MDLINKNKALLRKLCTEYKVKNLSVFGSVLGPNFSADSDIDFIVDIDDNDPLSYADKYFELKFALEDLFGRTIDLLEEKGLKNPILKAEIEQTKISVYG